MKNKLPKILILICVISFTGCHRMATTPTVDLSRFTPQPSETPVDVLPEPEVKSTLSLDTDTEKALRIYPLWVGSSWVYEYLGYEEDIEVIWRVVETVVEAEIIGGCYVAKLEREAEVIDGVPPAGFRSSPETGTFWYLIDGKNLYRFEKLSDTDLSDAWLDLVLPFPEAGEAWYPDPDQRAMLEPELIGSRYASDPFQGVLPMGGTYTCYNVAVHYDDRTLEQTFCENVGYVYKELNLYDHPYGYRSELKGFTLQ